MNSQDKPEIRVKANQDDKSQQAVNRGVSLESGYGSGVNNVTEESLRQLSLNDVKDIPAADEGVCEDVTDTETKVPAQVIKRNKNLKTQKPNRIAAYFRDSAVSGENSTTSCPTGSESSSEEQTSADIRRKKGQLHVQTQQEYRKGRLDLDANYDQSYDADRDDSPVSLSPDEQSLDDISSGGNGSPDSP